MRGHGQDFAAWRLRKAHLLDAAARFRHAGELPARRHALPRLRLADQHVQRLLAHDHGPIFSRELGNQRDRFLRSPHGIPGQPDAVGCAQFAGRVQLVQLLGRKGKLAVRHRRPIGMRIGIVVAVDQ